MTSNGAQDFNIAAIRQLLLTAFTPEELRVFCHDRPVGISRFAWELPIGYSTLVADHFLPSNRARIRHRPDRRHTVLAGERSSHGRQP